MKPYIWSINEGVYWVRVGTWAYPALQDGPFATREEARAALRRMERFIAGEN